MSDKSVLIVDDEETLTWSMSKSLAKDKSKYNVLLANNGKEALSVMNKNKVDLAILDIRMPGINGLDLLMIIKKKFPETKVIIMTAYGSQEIQEEANRRGSLYYIEKPFEIQDIRKLILDAIGEKEEDGFEGQVRGLQLSDIIQMNCLGRITTALIVSKTNMKGTIYFNRGEIVHAEYNDIKGVEAFYDILNWQSGNFSFQNGAVPDEETIDDRWEFLLMEAMRRRDEATKVDDPEAGEIKRKPVEGFVVEEEFYEQQIETEALKEPAKTDSASAPPPPAPKKVKPAEMTGMKVKIGYPEVAHRLRQIKGCLGALFFDLDGEIIFSDRREEDVKKESSSIQPLLDLVESFSANFPLGGLALTSIHYEKTQKIIVKKNDFYLFIYLTHDISFEDIENTVKRNLDRID